MITLWILAITDWTEHTWFERIITIAICMLMDYGYLCKYTDIC